MFISKLSQPTDFRHPRRLGWFGTACIAMGGSNQSLFLLSALLIGQGDIPGQSTAAIPLLIIGVIISWMAAPGWVELILMFPNRIGGIAACCAEAFRPYSETLANLTGVCYWWGWVPTCGVSALISAAAIQSWYLPWVSVPCLATLIVLMFTWVNLRGIHFASMVAIPIATISGGLAFLSGLVPIFSGHVNWTQAMSFHLHSPFSGTFGNLTSLMAGLYLIGFAAPAFEQATCHVGETIDQNKNVPRAVFAAAVMAGVYFILLPIVWLGAIGPEKMSGDLAQVLGPTFAPLFGASAKAVAIWFMAFNMFHDTIAPLAGASRTMSQIADDGLLPEIFSVRSESDAPIVATILTALISIIFLWIGDPIWLIAAANFTYLIGIALPNVAVWLLRKNLPDLHRPYRASNLMIRLGLISAAIWGIATIFGFEQFGLPTVLIGVAFAYAGSILYIWRKANDRRRKGLPLFAHTIHVKLTGAMLTVLTLDAIGYLIAVEYVPKHYDALITVLSDIFVAVAILTIAVGLVVPGMIARSLVLIAKAAEDLAHGTVADFKRAMIALGEGRLKDAYATINYRPVHVYSRDEVSNLANSFNLLQTEIADAAKGLDNARDGLSEARNALVEINSALEGRVKERTKLLEETHQKLLITARRAGMAEVATSVLHNIGNILNSANVSSSLLLEMMRKSHIENLFKVAEMIKEHISKQDEYLINDPQGKLIPDYLLALSKDIFNEHKNISVEINNLDVHLNHIESIVAMQKDISGIAGIKEKIFLEEIVDLAIQMGCSSLEDRSIKIVKNYQFDGVIVTEKSKLLQILVNLIQNAKDSLKSFSELSKLITITIKKTATTCIISVKDNGSGITNDNLTKIFSIGFTTKIHGHGFGLHSSSIAAKELGGSLMAESAGIGKGATFIVELPLASQLIEEKTEET